MAGNKRTHTVQTPGEPVVGDAPPEQLPVDSPTGAAEEASAAAPAVAALLPNGEVRKEIKLDPAVRNASEEAPVSAARSANELPDQKDVDPAKIPFGQRVMTKQGWLCSEQDPPQQVRR